MEIREYPHLLLGYLAVTAVGLSMLASWVAGFGKIQGEVLMPRFYVATKATPISDQYVDGSYTPQAHPAELLTVAK